MRLTISRIISRLDLCRQDIVDIMEDMDTKNWHDEVKYPLADLNALFVLIDCTRRYADSLLDTHEDFLEEYE